MKIHRTIQHLLLSTLLLSTAATQAGSHTGAPPNVSPAMADGEVRRIDIENKKLTIRHGQIKHLDMPGMTMVFQVQDPALLGRVKVGDKIAFMAEKSGNTIVVTAIESAAEPTK